MTSKSSHEINLAGGYREWILQAKKGDLGNKRSDIVTLDRIGHDDEDTRHSDSVEVLS
jgi:hypothetical protein